MQTGPVGEKRWTIVLSIDMVDFTGITQDIGDEATYDLLHHMLGVARDVITHHGGHVIDTAGDGILAAFGAPRAMENAPLQGCKAALDFQDRVAKLTPDLQRSYGIIPRFRTGIAGGDAMVAHLPQDGIKVVGDPVNKVARLQSLAGPGEIIIGASIFREAEGFIAATPHKPVTIKGFAAPVETYTLTALQDGLTRFAGTERRGIVDLVSRQTELDDALSALNAAVSPQLLVITGIAGIGKSRLTHEVITRIAPTRAVYLGQCSPDAQQSFGPIYDILRQISPVAQGATQNDVLRAVQNTYPDLVDAEMFADVIAPIGPQSDPLNHALQERSLLMGLLLGMAETHKAVFVIEDAHWCDAATAELLAMLSETPIPIVITGRPSFAPAWLQLPTVKQITLAPLSAVEITDIVAAHLNGEAAPALSDMIATKSEGIPLIAEEIIRALQYGDQLEHTGAGLMTRAGNTTLVTGNLAHLVLSRVDRLPEADKLKLHYAAAIGRDFSANVVSRAAQDETPLSDFAGLLEHRRDTQWRFTHALIRDAIYDSLLSAQKAQIHLRVAQAFETSNDNNSSRLADHYILAGHAPHAVPYLIAAAKQNLLVYDLAAVDRDCERAMQIISDAPDCVDEETFGALAALWVRALDNGAQYGRLQSVAARVLPRLQDAGYTQTLTIVRTLHAIAMTHTRAYDDALTLTNQALAQAQDADDPLGAAWAKSALMRIYEETYQQPPDVIERLAAEIEPVALAHGDKHLAMTSQYLLSAMFRSTGRSQRALATAEKIAKLSKSHNDRRARGYANWVKALVHVVEGNPEAIRAQSAIGKQDVIAGAADDYAWEGVSIYVSAMLDPPEKAAAAIAAFRARVDPLCDVSFYHSADWVSAALAFKEGRLALGWRKINTLIAACERAGNMSFTRQAYLLRSEVLLSLAGLTDPKSEAPADRPVYPRTKPGFADLMTFVKLRLRARQLAKRDLDHCIALDPLKYGGHYARAQIGLGLVAASQGRTEDARKLIQDGMQNAEQEGLQLLIKRGHTALSKFGLKTPSNGIEPS